MKILLAYMSGVADRSDPYVSVVPSGLCSLHSCLREAGFDTLLANFSGWNWDAVTKQLRAYRPDMVGISQWTHNRHASLELATQVRRAIPTATILFGGAHASNRYRELLAPGSPVDAVVLGEGEDTLLEIATHAAVGRDWQGVRGIACRRDGGIAVNGQRPPLADLDRLPYAGRYLEYSIGVDRPLQAEFILTARGCPSACYFCSSPSFWRRRVRFRSPGSMYDEIRYMRGQYGLIYFSLRDDTFTADRARTIEFCRLLIEGKAHILWNCQSRVSALDEEMLIWMKRAGCECVQLGVESGSPDILKRLGKAITPAQVEKAAAMIKKIGINLSIYLISDVPGETEADIRQTLELVRRIRPDDGYVSPLAYYPGTRLFDEAVASGLVAGDIFEKSREPALYAAGAPGSASRRLLKALTGRGGRDGGHFRRQKQLLGYCGTTNVLAGEWQRQHGDFTAAEQEFLEITAREADNPWGWYLLGELYREFGEGGGAAQCYRKVLEIVPGHAPSLAALGTCRTQE